MTWHLNAVVPLMSLLLCCCSATPVQRDSQHSGTEAGMTLTNPSRAEREAVLASLGAPHVDPQLLCEKYLTKVPFMPYPHDALRGRQEGWVLLEFSLDGTGHAAEVMVVRSKPKLLFSESAIETLRTMEFKSTVTIPKCRMLIYYFLR